MKRPTPATPQPIAAILEQRSGEEMALNERYLNPQMGRILRTLGFDKVWSGGEGAHLIDSTGERYLDLFGGYGVFAVGRNRPEGIAAIEEVLAAHTGNLPQLGVTLLSGVLAEQLIARAPASVGAVVPANSGTEAVEAAIKIARAATGRPRVIYAEHGFHGLTLGSLSVNGNEEFRAGFGPLLAGFDAVAFGDLDALQKQLEGGDVAAFIVEPVQGKGVNLPPDGYLRAARELCRAANALFVCDEVQTGVARTGRFLALESGVRQGVRRDGAGRAPRVDVRRQRSRGGGRAGDAERDRRRAAGRARATPRREAARTDSPARRAPRGRSRGSRPRADVGDRVRPAARAHLARAVG